MGNYDLVFRKSALRELKKLPAGDLRMLWDAILALRENPRPAQSVKLTAKEQYRLRKGRYRVLYEIEDSRLIVVVVKVAQRKDAYRTT